MNLRPLFYVTFALCASLFAAGATHQLEMVKEAPDGLSEQIAAELNPEGHRIVGPDGAICDIWLLKSIEVKPGFKPTLTVKYPFTDGQLIGALRVAEEARFTDFRGQRLPAGVYTLRYGQQPQDGNHIGTSDQLDFLLALPPSVDTDPKLIPFPDRLHQQSAEAASSTHPANFSLLPAEEKDETPSLEHDESHDFWILNLTVDGRENDEAVKLPMRMVVIGETDE